MEEVIKFIIEDIALIISAFVLVITINKSLKIYQDARYKLYDAFSLIRRYYRQYYLYLVIIPFLFILDLWYVQLIYIVYISYLLYQLLKKRTITKLRFTPRIIRQYILIVFLETSLATILFINLSIHSFISVLALFIILSPLITIACGGIILPIEMIIVHHFQMKAKKKLIKYQPIIIGITGSCGKTSVKNYLFEMLKTNQLVYMSPKSFNTINGISMTINEYLNFYNSVLILEMGATKRHDIEELVNYTHPQYGFVTEITSQHMQTFKSIDNIIKEKFKLIEGLPQNGIGFLNYDNSYIRSYPLKANCKIITYGTTSDCDVFASDIVMTLEGLSFTVNYHSGNFKVKSKLVGHHNVNNLLAAIACSLQFNVSIQEIIDAIDTIEPVKHRLEIRHEGKISIIDDAYNSNPFGFKNALSVLNLAKDKKTLITPGIVEAGVETETINYQLAGEIANVCDEVILVDNPSSRFIYQGLLDLGYKNITMVSNFKEGFSLIKEGTVLIENDLPDNYFI